jgi:hypothetical protein
VARLVSRLKIIADKTDPAVGVALHDTANFILMLIRAYAPVDTGWLRDSYKKESLNLTHILVGSMVNYSIHQEYGTSRGQRFTPHVRPAFHQSGTFFEKALAARLKDLG